MRHVTLRNGCEVARPTSCSWAAKAARESVWRVSYLEVTSDATGTRRRGLPTPAPPASTTRGPGWQGDKPPMAASNRPRRRFLRIEDESRVTLDRRPLGRPPRSRHPRPRDAAGRTPRPVPRPVAGRGTLPHPRPSGALLSHLCRCPPLRWRLGFPPTARRSPQRVRQALLNRQCSVFEDLGSVQHDAIPSRPSAEAMYRGWSYRCPRCPRSGPTGIATLGRLEPL